MTVDTSHQKFRTEKKTDWTTETLENDILYCVTPMFSLSSHSSQFNFCPIRTFPCVLKIDTSEDDILGR